MFSILLVIGLLDAAVGLRFLVIGDWGTGGDTQTDVAAAMAQYADSNTVDFIMATGDNFYPDGVFSADDEQFKEKWRDIYTGSLSSITWYISMGNHDHRGGGEQYQIDFGATEARWYLPDYKYSWINQTGNTKALFISYDSQAITQGTHDDQAIEDFVRTTLQQYSSSDTWKFVFGHHPAYSCASRTINTIIESRIIAAMDEHNADVYWAGHEHNLQHLRRTGSNMNVDHIVSGAGGAGTYAHCEECCQIVADAGVESLHFTETNGFTVVDVMDKTMTVSHRNEANTEIYSYTRTKP